MAKLWGGSAVARLGITRITETDDWETASKGYRMLIFGKGAQPKAYGGGVISTEQMQKVMQAGGKLPRAVLLRCRVRFFSDGAILGSKVLYKAYLRRIESNWVSDDGEWDAPCRERTGKVW